MTLDNNNNFNRENNVTYKASEKKEINNQLLTKFDLDLLKKFQSICVMTNSIESNKPRFEVIVVDLKWIMLNGLVDLNRDVLMKLIKITDDDAKTRSVCEFFQFVILNKIFFFCRLLGCR
jgi:hypothetical protein